MPAINRDDMRDMLWFLAVAEAASFTKAAAKLGTSQSTLSHTIKQLEARLGLKLFTRTTRSVAPTEAGERLLQSLAPRIAAIEHDVDELMVLRDKPSGSVRLTVSDHAYDTVVWPKLRPMLVNYPDIHLEVSIDNTLRNIVEDRFDAGIRLGENLDRDTVGIRVSPDWRLVAVAAPDYLSLNGIPEAPHDLMRHNCMNHRQGRSGGLYAWEFARNGSALRVRVSGQLTFSSSLAMIDAAISGYGIAYIPENLVEMHIAAGTLVQVLDDWSPLFSGYYLYYPRTRQVSPAMSVIVETLRLNQVNST